MNYSLHNHTYRCKHAKGDENNMVLQAIVEGFEVFGISDHVAYNTKATNYRMEFEERFDYLNTLKELKDLYQDKITLYRGFEAEYQKEFSEYLKDFFRNDQIDYLVLGQHYYNVHKPVTYYGGITNKKDVTTYVNHCIKAMESGMFLFLAHADLFLNSGLTYDHDVRDESLRLIQAAMDNNVYLEYNAGGIRNGMTRGYDAFSQSYPRNSFWQDVSRMQAPVVINADAHSPAQINDLAYQQALIKAAKLQLNVVEKVDFNTYKQRIKDII